MDDIFKEILNVLARGERAALSTIVSSKGSLPMSKKAKMLVKQDGKIIGTVGGGCLEADVWAEAKRVMGEEMPNLQTFILTEKHAGESGLNCGGNVEIFTEPIMPGRSNEVFEEIVKIRTEDKQAVLATLVSGGRAQKMLVERDGRVVGSLGNPVLDNLIIQEVEEVIQEDLLKVFTGEGERIFVEAILPEPTLFLFGGGHVSKAIARVAKTVGFRLVVIDDRPAFASLERFPEADEVVVDDFRVIVGRLPIDESSYLVAVTRGHQWDEQVIEQVVWTKAKYIGMIGSRRKIALMWKRFEERGIPRSLLEAVHAPIGIDIHADTPEEIAVSVVAELIKVRREKGKPGHVVDQEPSRAAVA
ncbi:MAG: XdhC family protein [Candidatus Latescibacteria bacterium]|nr:XdhC family protein [Candidatus Latescibacterota bacterium]